MNLNVKKYIKSKKKYAEAVFIVGSVYIYLLNKKILGGKSDKTSKA